MKKAYIYPLSEQVIVKMERNLCFASDTDTQNAVPEDGNPKDNPNPGIGGPADPEPGGRGAKGTSIWDDWSDSDDEE